MTSTGWFGHEQYIPAHRRTRQYVPAHRRPRRHAPAHLRPAPVGPAPARRAAMLVAVPALAGLAAAGATTALTGAGDATLGPIALTAATGRSYTVRAGDTLGAIAARFGTTVAHLAARNHLADPNRIRAGQVLVIPGAPVTGSTPAPPGASPPTAGRSYTVRAGDTLGAIAARFGTTVAHLVARNHLADPNRIYVGDVIALPPDRAATPVGHAGPSGRTGAGEAPPTAGRSYTVRAGDTLGAIAARFGTTVAHLVARNHLADPNQIYVGEVIRLSPARTAAVPGAPRSGGPSGHAAPESAQAAAAVRTALAQVGKPYEWGGAGPHSFDCSGLVMYAWEAAGVNLPHYSVSQLDDTTPVSRSQLEPGDIVFYDTPSGPQPGHDALYIGHDEVVSANDVGTDVQTQSIGYDGRPVAFGRVR